MNELIIVGIVIAILMAMFALTTLIENIDTIGEWWFDLCTAYFKWKHRRKAKR